jgi:tetratricopeptide (TPR) repeat protein
MSRKDRRAAIARGKSTASSSLASASDLFAEATLAYQQKRFQDAELICTKILSHTPKHAAALNLLGVLYQTFRNHRLAVKTFAKALMVNEFDAASHYNIALSYQALGQRDPAAADFKKAIALGLSGQDVEQFLLQNPVVAEYARR